MCYIVVTMFIDDQSYVREGRTYRRVLLRNSFRVDGKVRHETVANLSKCSDKEVAAIKLALKHKENLNVFQTGREQIHTKQGLSVGALFLLKQLADRLGITRALGNSREGKLVLWLVFAAAMEQGSRLSAVRLAQRHAVCDLLNLDGFNEDDLYAAMDWLEQNQEKVEKRLFDDRHGSAPPRLYLYDVTSSYFEGTQNELAAFGYNRDGKKGKMQIVIGLLTDAEGRPVSVEVFPGNTSDVNTFGSQVRKVKERFDGHNVVFVGDRGMIKGPRQEGLPEDFHYVTAISKPQIEKLLSGGVLQMDLFEETVCETTDGHVRYILRRNPVRAQQMAETRRSKRASIEELVKKKNQYLHEHPRARPQTAKRKIQQRAKRLKLCAATKVSFKARTVRVEFDDDALAQAGKLDGCYVIKTDLPTETADAMEVHGRYMALTEVEWAFRTMKTVLLEMRAIFVRKAARTRAHVSIIMLAYLLAFELRRLWRDIEMTVEEGLRDLSELCATQVCVREGLCVQTVPEPRESGKQLLAAANVTLPDALPCRNAEVVTRKKLVEQRRSTS